jgi:uncharacterized protein
VRDSVASKVVSRLPAEYTVVNKDGTPPHGVPEPLGEGGSSVVVRAIYRNRLHRAIKIMIPRADLSANLSTGLFAESFENEVVALADLGHEHIAKLTDFGTIIFDDAKYPFVITEFVEGMPLDRFCKSEDTSGHDIITALNQVLDALVYMHGRNIMHCDLKPANIIMKPVNAYNAYAVILDLGVSHRIDHDPKGAREWTYFFSTPRYVMSGLKPYLGNESRNRIAKGDLLTFFPWQDLHSFGVILDDLVSDDDVRKKLERYIGPHNLTALRHMRARLVNPGNGSDHYATARDVQKSLARVPFSAIAPLGVPELAPVPQKGVVLPTSRRVPMSDRVDAVIEHPLFQRLHKLPQLDLLHLVLPGATHTRFVHALHVFDLARVAICHQLGNWDFRLDVDSRDIDCALFGALLDSVGRYHFQHMFEDFLPDRKQPGLKNAGILTDNELLDAMMGAQPGSELSGQLGRLQDTQGRVLSDIFHDCLELDWSELRQRQKNPETPVQGFLAGLLSSPVDVDKLAYLIDDSAFSGLPFGHAVAPAPVFEALRVPHPADWAQMKGVRVAVALREKALSYVEQAVLSRYWNIQTGYWYRTNRSLQAMVKYQIGALLRGNQLHFDDLIMGTLHLSGDGALRWLDRAFKDAIRNGAIEDSTVDPMEGILGSRREVYKRIVTISPKSLLDSRSQDRFIYEGLRGRSALDDVRVCESVARALERVKPGLRVRPGEVLLDLPRVRREEIGGRLLVYADDPGAELLGDLSNISLVLAALREQFDLYAKRLRIFVHPRLYRELEDVQQSAYQEVLDMLRSDFDGGTP